MSYMKNYRLAAVMVVTLLGTAGIRSLVAQEAQPPSGQQDQTQPQQPKAEKSQQELKVSDQEMKQQVTDANKASKLIGMQVKNKQDEDLGKIKELVVDLQSGKIAYAVLGSGGLLGVRSKMVAVPIQALTLQQGEKSLLLDLPKQQLSQAPGFTDQNWPDLNAAQKGETVGLARPTAQGAAGSQSGQSSGSGTNQPEQQKQQEPPK